MSDRVGDGSALAWLKSSLSMHNGSCVEVAGLGDGTIHVRNSRHPEGAVLSFTPAEWDAFLGGVQLGEFNRRK
jgi:hypothetical protein